MFDPHPPTPMPPGPSLGTPSAYTLAWGSNISREPVMAQENEHIQTLVAERLNTGAKSQRL